jgi:hypothetical protein
MYKRDTKDTEIEKETRPKDCKDEDEMTREKRNNKAVMRGKKRNSRERNGWKGSQTKQM